MPPFGVHCDAISSSRRGAMILAGILVSTVLPLTATVLTTAERSALTHEAFLEERRAIITGRVNPYLAPEITQIVEEHPEYPAPWKVRTNPWHYQIRATVFWVGKRPTARNPVSNSSSSWDPDWEDSFGGYDHPFKRKGYFPSGFEPRLNPFYVALPYNDLLQGLAHRPEASRVIPWFWRSYRGPGISVCHNRWVAIHHKGRIAYAQWKDAGPFTIDDWPYVFEGKRPRSATNQNAGIDISPAVRDFLDIRGNADVDWRFVEESEVPAGPWKKWLPARSESNPPNR